MTTCSRFLSKFNSHMARTPIRTLAIGSSGSPAVEVKEQPKRKRISVIGGGLGGLAFAQAMKSSNSNVDVTVFERDAAAEHRSQGYQIGIHRYGRDALDTLIVKGVPGLKELLAENPMTGVMIADSQFQPYFRIPVSEASLVNRWKLRDVLLHDINVVYNKRFRKYEESKDGVRATFEDGTVVESDLLVAADGVRSRIREHYRPDFQFHSTGIGAIAGFFDITNPDNQVQVKQLDKTFGNNLFRAQLDNRHSLLCMRFIAHDGKPQILWAISFEKELGDKKFGALPADEHATAELKEALLKRLQQEPNPELKALIRCTLPENIILQKDYLSMVPESIKNAHSKASPASTFQHVVLLGDAAHAMTTHAGLGANTAIKDAIDLAAIVQDPTCGLASSQWNTVGHPKYEKALFERGYEAVKTSLGNTRRIHSDKSAVASAMMSSVGFGVKCYNLLRHGKFGF